MPPVMTSSNGDQVQNTNILKAVLDLVKRIVYKNTSNFNYLEVMTNVIFFK